MKVYEQNQIQFISLFVGIPKYMHPSYFPSFHFISLTNLFNVIATLLLTSQI